MADYFGIRVLYILVCWAILGNSIRLATDSDIVSLISLFMLFYLPLSLDYWTHKPKDANDKLRKKIGIRVPATIFTLGLIILIVRIPTLDNFISFPFVKYGFFLLSGFFVYLAYKDWIAYSSDEEEKYIEETINQHRLEVAASRSESASMEEKRKYYRSVKNNSFIQAKKRRKK